jgi:uncharacterized repeat protein (TIGR03803 family)
MNTAVRLFLLSSTLTAIFCLTSCGSGAGGNNLMPPPPPSYTANIIYNFGFGSDGWGPTSLVFDTQGNLFGTTLTGGAYHQGTIFKLTQQPGGSWTESILYSFCPNFNQNCPDGTGPSPGLVFDSAGNLYGTTQNGGAYAESGVVFELSPQKDGTWTETVLHSFGNGSDGAEPEAGLTFDKAGNLYGTTYRGGSSPACFCGTVFELSPAANGRWTEQVLYNFCSLSNCADGQMPTGGVIFDSAGNLYGTTSGGGLFPNAGTVFELGPGTGNQWTESVLYALPFVLSYSDLPGGTLVQDKSGNLYGATQLGDSGSGIDQGTVFEVSHGSGSGWNGSVIYSLCSQDSTCADGAQPLAGVTFDQAGNVYGTTSTGGAQGWGVVFVIRPQSDGSWHGSTLYSFLGHEHGSNPGRLIFDSSGNLYGVASDGSYGGGIVYKLTHMP